MDFDALVGRAARFSPDAHIVVRKASDESDGVNLLYANPSFRFEIGCDLDVSAACACTLRLGDIDFSNQAVLSVDVTGGEAFSFRVSVTVLPEAETGQSDCYLLIGRPSGISLSEGREKLYSDIARKFIELPADDAARAAVRAAGLYFDADRCFAARVDLSTDINETRYFWSKNSDQRMLDRSRKTMCSWILGRLRQNEVVQIENIANLPDDADGVGEALRDYGAEAALLAPVLLARGTLWLIGMHFDEPRIWNTLDVSTFKVIGDLLGNAFTQTETVWSLRETQRRFSDVGANIPGVVYQIRRDSKGRVGFSYISQGVRELTGWGPASMMSDPELLEKTVLREDRGRYREILERAGQEMSDWSIDIRIQHRKTEEVLWVRAGGRAHRGANGDTVWNGLLLDISESKKAEKALRVSEERLRRILGTSPIAIGISDVKEFQLLFANKRLADMYRIPKSQIIGYDTRKFYVEKKLHRRHWVETRREKFLSSVETRCLRADGMSFWAEISTRLIEYGGRQAILWWAFDITEHKNTKEALAHLAHHDPLTGLANRRLFDEHLKNGIALAARTERAGVLFYFDLDGFKGVNDKFGHGFGDWVLVQVGMRLRKVLRDTDIGARLGGDEFAVIAHGIDDLDAIEAVIDKMQDAISAPYEKDGQIAKIGLSIGVVRFFGKESDTQKIVTLADGAMYEAKQAGKGTYRLINMPQQDGKKAFS
ncbi:diguanylate cyclase [Terasakiella sp. A23]|uniref:diguanylate cyclase domain-containing protein n=1 Tax=Terasakiella sp. FCG-A23 TaxID=3080561 RepID=UPI00295502D2|nr:diguanylate cyclase [Terasakiella sp. A23]MDV7341132.1 diguanylate cyclase [Terasakiella sp. A23]